MVGVVWVWLTWTSRSAAQIGPLASGETSIIASVMINSLV